MLGSVYFLQERFTQDSDCYEDIAAIASGAADMKKVVDDISDWVKVSVGQLDLKLQPVSVTDIVNDVVSKAVAEFQCIAAQEPHLNCLIA